MWEELRKKHEETDNPALLLQQLKNALEGKPSADPQKAALKALVTEHNRTVTSTGANTLKPDIWQKLLTNAGAEQNMSEWLANFNRQDEGEFQSFQKCEIDGECKHNKVKSGILDKCVNGIQQ